MTGELDADWFGKNPVCYKRVEENNRYYQRVRGNRISAVACLDTDLTNFPGLVHKMLGLVNNKSKLGQYKQDDTDCSTETVTLLSSLDGR
jgi:hypothetical protein